MSKQKRTPAYEKLLEEIQQLPLGHERTAKLGKLAAEHDRLWQEVANSTTEEGAQQKLAEALSLNERAAPLFTQSRDPGEFADYLQQQLTTIEMIAMGEDKGPVQVAMRSDFARQVAAEAYGRAVELRESDDSLTVLPEWTDDPIAMLQQLREWCVRSRATATSPKAERRPATHSPTYRSVNWYGETYTFTGNQAACVKTLWEAWGNGTPDIADDHMLDKAGIETKRLRDVFRNHPAWGTMIVQGKTKGTHRLNLPEKI
ncbi:hypothetical protein LCGC14_0017170 [marine sediment metagenome]|uniref:Uncharacterized protein n=1 Tax=marine sediment metagenome TaxID=412755 RepID=A0A0F9W1Q8_9ZZZZ|nr:hypothetical protein [Phycisphaerae bacterium]HDZ42423.1 hypothetical protein [Phycisphaerae bacterium]